MKQVNVTNKNGVAFVSTIAINLDSIIKYYNNATTKAVIRYDNEPGSRAQPISYTLDISKATLDALIATDATITTMTADVYSEETGVTTSTTFNEKYLVSLKDSKAYIAGVLDTSVVEFTYSDGGYINKKLYVNSTLATLVSSNLAEILTYSFAGVAGSTTTINAAARTIAATVPFGTALGAIVSTFTKSVGLTSIKVGVTAQVSATTPNDFSAPITYTLIAADAITTRTWVVTVTVDDIYA